MNAAGTEIEQQPTRALATTNGPPIPIASNYRGERGRLVRHAKILSWLSVSWMTIEAGGAIVAALLAGSVALLGFGLDSLIELFSASIII